MSIYKGNTLIAGVAKPKPGTEFRIGQIIPSTLPIVDAGLHLLDGSILDGNGIYRDFVDYIASLYTSASPTPTYFCTELEWQTSVGLHGVCGKFVFDSSARTVRLPKITGFIEGTIDQTSLGALMEAGLPNITGYAGTMGGYSGNPTGAFYSNGTANSTNGGDRNQEKLYIDASRSSSVYGKSDTVQPQAIKVLFYICVASTTKTDIEVDIDRIATDLNSKLSKDNLIDASVVIDTYANGMSGYRIWSDGYCEQWGECSISQDTRTVVNLLKRFNSTNYSVLISAKLNGNQTSGDGNFTWYPISDSSFYWSNGDDFSGNGTWKAFGFLATGEY